MQKKRLILVPDLEKQGGVAGYYSSLRKHFTEKVEYFTRGTRANSGLFTNIILYLTDYIRYLIKLGSGSYDLVLVNSSLGKSGYYRDIPFILIARLLRINYVVFFRGWDDDCARSVKSNSLFKNTFLTANKIIVLANGFQEFIRSCGYTRPCIVETTAVDQDLLTEFNTSSIKTWTNLLFLSRLSADKGVLKVLDAFEILKRDIPELKLTIAGSGEMMDPVKKIVENRNLKNVTLTGYISGEQKAQVLADAGIFLFPSNYNEGMPNAVLEAMAFGLPVITSRAGGITDFFIDGQMGVLLNDTAPASLVTAVKNLCNKPEILSQISRFNTAYAKENFYSGVVAERLEKLLAV
ncbi:MAG: glycosyltransferase family 4 protein [Bacteroidetes bacterium]|nr:glycosyltransferase family 4 protein [Bacteroidota bacterium]